MAELASSCMEEAAYCSTMHSAPYPDSLTLETTAMSQTTWTALPFVRRCSTVLAIAALSFTAACASDSISAPSAAAGPSAAKDGLIGTVLSLLTPVQGITRTTSLNAPVSASVKFTSAGGVIAIPSLGLKVTVPAGAIPTSSMTITVTALAGNTVAYDFQPHGTKFLKPLRMEQSLVGTNLQNTLLKPTLYGAYFENNSQVNTSTGSAMINELLSAVTFSNTVSFNINHFSGYMVSTGRSKATAAEME